MIITCNECETSFNLDAKLISEDGTKVRCSKCNHIFTAFPSDDAEGGEAGLAVSDLESEEFQEEMPSEDDMMSEDLDAGLDDFFDESEAMEAGDDEMDVSDDDPGLPKIDELQAAEDMGVELDALASDTVGDDSALDEDLPPIEDLTDMESSLESVQLGDGSPEDAELDLDLSLDDDADGGGEEPIDFKLDNAELDSGELDLSGDDLTVEEPEAAADELDGGAGDPTGGGLDGDELDLSDLEAMLEADQAADEVAATDGAEDVLEMESESDLEDADMAVMDDAGEPDVDELELEGLEDIPVDGVSASTNGGASDEIELDLDLEWEDDADSIAPAHIGETDGELDFSDLEDMLADDTQPAGDDDFGMDLELEGTDAEAESTEAASADEEEDLFDIEKALEESEAPDVTDAAADGTEEVDLDLDMESEEAEAGSASGDDIELEFDLEGDLDEPQETFQNDDLEFNLLEDDQEAVDVAAGAARATAGAAAAVGSTTDDFVTEEFTDASDLDGATDVMLEESDYLPEIATTRSRSRTPLVLILLLLVLVAGVLVVPKMFGVNVPYVSDLKIPYLSDMDLEIPFLSKLIASKPADSTGNLKITPLGKTITAKFVDNAAAGRLFVVKGQLRNEYAQPRSFIRVTANLLRADHKQAGSATVYAGNSLSASELKRLDMNAINKRLQNKFGDKQANLKVKTGRVIPFMIVFDKIPEGLDEYTVEVAGSTDAR